MLFLWTYSVTSFCLFHYILSVFSIVNRFLKNIATEKDKDRDEYPPAMFKEGGNGASVKKIDSSDNRGAGSSIGQQYRGLACGTQVKIVVK